MRRRPLADGIIGHGGQSVAFAHDPSVEADPVFRVLEEPKTQPGLGYW